MVTLPSRSVYLQGFGAWCYDSLQRCTLGAPSSPSHGPRIVSAAGTPSDALYLLTEVNDSPPPHAGNNPCNEDAPCMLAPSYCSTGVAGDYAGAFNYFCNSSAPPPELATPNGAGHLCWATMESCMAGGNACDSSFPCTALPSTCFTGVVRKPASGHPTPPQRTHARMRSLCLCAVSQAHLRL